MLNSIKYMWSICWSHHLVMTLLDLLSGAQGVPWWVLVQKTDHKRKWHTKVFDSQACGVVLCIPPGSTWGGQGRVQRERGIRPGTHASMMVHGQSAFQVGQVKPKESFCRLHGGLSTGCTRERAWEAGEMVEAQRYCRSHIGNWHLFVTLGLSFTACPCMRGHYLFKALEDTWSNRVDAKTIIPWRSLANSAHTFFFSYLIYTLRIISIDNHIYCTINPVFLAFG